MLDVLYLGLTLLLFLVSLRMIRLFGRILIEGPMSTLYVLAAIVAIGLFVYLFVALLYPEKLQ